MTPPRSSLALGAAAALLLLLASARAWAESDSGTDCETSACDDGGGVDAPPLDAGSDGGMSRMDGGGAGSADGGGAGEDVACSCHTASEAERGARIHVCTESSDPDVCRNFDCDRGTVRSRGCPSDGVRLCCEMRGRDLATSLYEDCTHPNCESGFREQCREFGGTVSEGPCESAIGGGDGEDSDDDGLCSVVAPGSRARGAGALSVALGLPALRLTRRRRARR